MCMLLHRYSVCVILFANWIPFYNSGSVFDRIPLSIYALQCYMYLWSTVITICIAVELLFVYNGVFLFCVLRFRMSAIQFRSCCRDLLLDWRCIAMFFVGSYDLDLDI